MKVTSLWGSSIKPTISFELFPARSEKAAIKLDGTIDMLAALRPDFVSVTFGAGGSTREGSYQLVNKLINEKGLQTMAYFAGYGLGPEDITSILSNYAKTGVKNVLVVRGDKTNDKKEFKPHPGSLPHASDLMALIKPEYGFCLGAAGYPEGHVESENLEKDIEYLKVKVKNGAEYIICNYFYDNQYFFDFVDKCRSTGINVPILPGVMPVYSIKMMKMLTGLCGATITRTLKQGLDSLPDGDKDAVVNFGIEFAVNQCRELLEKGVAGLHFYTMNLSQSSVEIVKRLKNEGLL